MTAEQKKNEVDIFKDIKLPRGLSHISEIVAVIKDTVDKAYVEREESTTQDEKHQLKGEQIS